MKMQQCLCQASHWQLIPSEFCFALSHFPLLLPTSETSEWKWNTMKIYSKQDKKFLITLELDLTALNVPPFCIQLWSLKPASFSTLWTRFSEVCLLLHVVFRGLLQCPKRAESDRAYRVWHPVFLDSQRFSDHLLIPAPLFFLPFKLHWGFLLSAG